MRGVMRRQWLLCVFGLALAGCGGSGGDGPSNEASAVLTYTVDWSRVGNNVTGQSQDVELRDLTGRVLQERTLNRSTALTRIAFSAVPRGSYLLVSTLYAGRNLTGSRSGELRARLELTASQTFATAVGADVDRLVLTPPSARVAVQESRQFYARGQNNAGVNTFIRPEDLTWRVNGSVGTVDAGGLVVATARGNGAVVARDGRTGVEGAATLEVTPFVTTTSDWTVLVYLNAANDLAQFSEANVNQMERVANNPRVRFVVQWKHSRRFYPQAIFNGTRRYLLSGDTTSAINSRVVQNMGENVDMGSPQTLLGFINWAKTFYPARRYVLVVWNHGNGWLRSRDHGGAGRAFSYDDEFNTAIQTWQINQALGNHVFDILAWDASLMQMLEVAYEAKDRARYVVGSEESPPGAGYPYDLVFGPFRDNPSGATPVLARSFVDAMMQRYANSPNKITQSVIQTAGLPALVTAVSGLGSELTTHRTALGTLPSDIRDEAQAYSPRPDRTFRDLFDVADRFHRRANVVSVRNAAARVKQAIPGVVLYERRNSNSPGSRGISIDFSDADAMNVYGADYRLLRLARDSQWDEWLRVAP